MKIYMDYGAARGLTISKSTAWCLHVVAGMKCPDYGRRCRLDIPTPYPRLMDHVVMYRLDHDRVLLAEPYAQPEDVAEAARILAAVFDLKYAVGTPGSGPWAGTVDNNAPGRTALVPVAFARTQRLADLAVWDAAKAVRGEVR
jgi:hypothetical protein